MDVLEVIKKRRSVRVFQKREIPKGSLEKICEAGRWAPSGLNNQPWRFLILKDREDLKTLSHFTESGSVIRTCQAAIVVCLDMACSYNREKDLMAIGACIENMLLQACALKLGACWLGEILNKREAVSEFLNLEHNYLLMAVVAFGVSTKKKLKGHRMPLKKIIFKR